MMTDKDFRYEKDGHVIEAFQLTDKARYAEKDWPAWMDSRWLMSVDGQPWLDYGGKEMQIPALGWICNNPDGTVTIRGAMEMEEWAKVVKDEPLVVHPESGVELTDDVLAAAHSLKLAPDGQKNKPIDLKPGTLDLSMALPPNDNSVSCAVVTEVFTTLRNGDTAEAIGMLRGVLTERVKWCDCAPNQCIGETGLGCRKSSPLL